MDAAERLEMIRDKFNLTETDPIPEQIINTWILSTPQRSPWISVVKNNCKYDTNKLCLTALKWEYDADCSGKWQPDTQWIVDWSGTCGRNGCIMSWIWDSRRWWCAVWCAVCCLAGTPVHSPLSTVILQGELREIIKWHQLPSVLPVLSRQHDSVGLEVTGVFTGVISNMEHWRDLRSAQWRLRGRLTGTGSQTLLWGAWCDVC